MGAMENSSFEFPQSPVTVGSGKDVNESRFLSGDGRGDSAHAVPRKSRVITDKQITIKQFQSMYCNNSGNSLLGARQFARRLRQLQLVQIGGFKLSRPEKQSEFVDARVYSDVCF
jgi:hypothetical protein